jgi:hypothetical protein
MKKLREQFNIHVDGLKSINVYAHCGDVTEITLTYHYNPDMMISSNDIRTDEDIKIEDES